MTAPIVFVFVRVALPAGASRPMPAVAATGLSGRWRLGVASLSAACPAVGARAPARYHTVTV